MSKNIDEIVEEILPLIAIYVKYVGDKVYVEDVQYEEKSLMNQATCNARTHLKQALTEKKLVVPMSEEAILDILTCRKEIHRTMISVRYKGTTTEQMEEIVRKELAKSIYERQFKGDE